MSDSYSAPKRNNYDAVITGGASMDAPTAWFLTEHTDSCMRQPFSIEPAVL